MSRQITDSRLSQSLRPVIAVISIILFPHASGADETGSPPPDLQIVELGEEQYRVGMIDIDKRNQRFTVPAKVIVLEPGNPLEYLAVVPNGHKSYESLLEINTSAREFNLACILIGLDAGQGVAPRYQFDPEQAVGDPVKLSVSWTSEGKTITTTPGALFTVQGTDNILEDWVYTGSVLAADGAYLAEQVGTLIGFVHDPASIIEHRTGLGIGAYGAAQYDLNKLPPPGTVMQFIVDKVGSVSESIDPQ